MERRINEAAVHGNVKFLLNLLEEDVLVLDRFMVGCYAETPLHIASMLGHVEFVQEIVNRKPELAGQLNSWQSSPLHLASAKGYLEVVKILVSTNPEMCFARDREGRNPLHIATIKGHISVLRELVDVRLDAARSLIDRDETILHLCVRYNQLETLKFLVEKMGDNDEFVNSKDGNGNSILHMAVANKQVEAIKFLTTGTTVQVNAVNAYDLTALDTLTLSNRDVKDWEIGELLRLSGAMSVKNFHPSAHREALTIHESRHKITESESQAAACKGFDNCCSWHDDWFENMRSALMIVASLIATVAFQVGINPPGGVWQEPQEHKAYAPSTSKTYEAGYDPSTSREPGFSIWADSWPFPFNLLLAINTTGFVASLSIILLLISGIRLKRKWFMWTLMVIMWIAVTAMGVTYMISVALFTSSMKMSSAFLHIMLGIVCAMVLLLLGHIIRLLVRFTKYLKKKIIRRRQPSGSVEMNNVAMPQV